MHQSNCEMRKFYSRASLYTHTSIQDTVLIYHLLNRLTVKFDSLYIIHSLGVVHIQLHTIIIMLYS